MARDMWDEIIDNNEFWAIVPEFSIPELLSVFPSCGLILSLSEIQGLKLKD